MGLLWFGSKGGCTRRTRGEAKSRTGSVRVGEWLG